MTVRDSDRPGECDLCGQELPDTGVESSADGVFCSSGCEDVATTLGSGGDGSSRGSPDGPDPGTNAPAPDRDALEETYLHVDGMHCATCEAYLERLATGVDGVAAAEASYVTETVRVRYDADRTSVQELSETLSTTGYAAVPRDDSDANRPRPDGAGTPDRGMDDLLGFRYAAGLLFGGFLLLPYVFLLYPAHVGDILGITLVPTPGDGGVLSGDGILVLPMFLVLTAVVLFFTGAPLLRGAYVSLKMRQPNTDLLVSVSVVSAFLYSTIAFALGRSDVFFDLTIAVAASVVAATYYETLAKRRAMDRLTDLTLSQITEATAYRDDGSTEPVPVTGLDPGDRVLVRQGERIPVDGVLAEGECTVDEAVVTGESVPVRKRAGDDLVGGAVVTDDAAVVRVGEAATSSIDRLTRAVWDLQSATHGGQRRADRLAERVLPPVAGLALLVGVAVLALGRGVPAAVLGALAVGFVASPWVIGLALPLSVATSLESALERGLVVFDETVFERLRDVDVVVFDKTGTLTTGEMEVVEATAPRELLTAVAALERRATHPVANAIVAAFAGDADAARPDGGTGSGTAGEGPSVSEFRTHGNGVGGTVDGTNVLAGTPACFADQGWAVSDEIESRVRDARGVGRLPVVVGRDGQAEGVILVGDDPREGWEAAVDGLQDRGIDVVVLTGDDEAAAAAFQRHDGIDHVFAGVPPAGKTAAIERLRADGYVTMVGDGTNDAPALARADLGIALGTGTALASDAADVTILDDDLSAVATAFDLAAAASRRLTQNYALALVYNLIAIVLSLLLGVNPVITAIAAIASGGFLGANAVRDLL